MNKLPYNKNWEQENVQPGDWVYIVRDEDAAHWKPGWKLNTLYKVSSAAEGYISCFTIEGLHPNNILHATWLRKVEPLVQYMLELEEDEN